MHVIKEIYMLQNTYIDKTDIDYKDYIKAFQYSCYNGHLEIASLAL